MFIVILQEEMLKGGSQHGSLSLYPADSLTCVHTAMLNICFTLSQFFNCLHLEPAQWSQFYRVEINEA